MPKAVQASNLSKAFNPLTSLPEAISSFFRKKSPFTVVDKVNLEVEEGEIFCLLGLNGAGKTTLLKMLATLIIPSEGKALVNGFDIVKEDIQVRRSIGLSVENERSFYWRLTGRQNLDFFASLQGLSSKQARKNIGDISEVLGLSRLLDKRYAEYSKGTKQKFSIARSIIHDPAILLFDEPTKSLDVVASKNLWNFVKEKLTAKKSKTIIFATHNIAEPVYADRIGIMHNGKIKIIDKSEYKDATQDLQTAIGNLFDKL